MEINTNIFIEPLRKYIKKTFPLEYNEQQMLLFGFTMDDFINPLVGRILSIPIDIEYTNDPKINPNASFNHEEFKIFVENINDYRYFNDRYRAGYSNYVNAVIFHEMVHAVDYIKKLYDKVTYNALEMGKKYYHNPEEVRAYRAMMKDFLEDELKIPVWRVRKMMSKYTTDLDAVRPKWLQEIQEDKVAKNNNWYKTSQQEYSTKDGRKITFQDLPFNENNDRRGWVVHKILAFVDNKEAGYITLSYIPKEKWDSIYKGNIWTFRRLFMGSYIVPEELENSEEEIIQKNLNDRYREIYYAEQLKKEGKKEYKLSYLYFVDKPIVDFLRVYPEFQRQRIGFALHQYATQWLKDNFGLHLWLSYCRTDMGKCFYDSKLFELKKYRYKEKMTGGFKQEREYVAKNNNWYKKSQKKKTIEEIAKQIYDKEVKYWQDDPDGLKNQCLPISINLKNELIKNGYKATVIQGTFSVDNPEEIYYDEDMKVIPKKEREEMMHTPLHYWVEVNGVIVDITAIQFNDRINEEIEPVIIGTYSELDRYAPKARGWK